jgi:5-methylcytosine-specific restriction endonuclease McrA
VAIGLRLRMYILRRDEFRCVYCGAEPEPFYLQVDHVVARANGGTTHPANLVTSCGPCNRRKRDQVIEVPGPVLALLAKETLFQWSDLRQVAV